VTLATVTEAVEELTAWIKEQDNPLARDGPEDGN
jgi:hypothetical protein